MKLTILLSILISILIALAIPSIYDYSHKQVSTSSEINPLEPNEKRAEIAVKKLRRGIKKRAFDENISVLERKKCTDQAQKFIPLGSPAKECVVELKKYSITMCEALVVDGPDSTVNRNARATCEDEFRRIIDRKNYQIDMWVSAGTFVMTRLSITVVDGKISKILCFRQF